jgi:S1-C subfamily serine protease
VAGALAASAGFGVAQVLDDDAPSSAPTATSVVPVTTERSSGDDTSGTVPIDGSEPVAAAAAAVAPAVVQIETRFGLGSGVIYDRDGHILTAAHVVEGAGRAVDVRLADGTVVDGEVLGADTVTDVAVVKIDGSSTLPVATLALDEPVRVGQLAVAVGSPFGLDQTVTSGIISAVDRSVRTNDGALSMLQTDAPINPGNSGGALADRSGRVIGINDAIATESGSNAGVGFAIPIDVAAAVAERIVAGEPITQAFLGIESVATTDGGGALIGQVVSGSPADAAGLERGDRIVSFDGAAVRDPVDLVAKVRSHRPGDVVSITYERDGAEHTTEATLADR